MTSNVSSSKRKLRKVVAIGDLHGDYYRLVRILEEQQILIPGTTVWNPLSDNVDLVLMGDYVDWRSEELEGDPDKWFLGSYKVLWLMKVLFDNVERLKVLYPEFDSKVNYIMGNHDDMMMDAANIFDVLSSEDIEYIVENPMDYATIAQRYAEEGIDFQSVGEHILKFLNWFMQGGDNTIMSFGGLYAWKNAMDGDMGNFLRKNLRLGVVINGRLYAHSIPDKKEFWIPFENIGEVVCGVKHKLKDAFLWGRKVWGYDYSTGMRTKPFTPEELEEMLRKIGIRGFVVGHTPMRQLAPLIAYEGKVVNVDLHGVPGSQPYVEIYYPAVMSEVI